jgi:hypothetical protein
MSDYAARSLPGTGGARTEGGKTAHAPERALALFLVAAALLALTAGLAFLLPPVLRLSRYEIVGNDTMTRAEVLSAALIHEKEYFFSIDPARVRAAIVADPRVASASVTKLFPNGLRIAVRERRPVAAALVDLDGRAAAVCLDAEGVAFAQADQAVAASVPVISGLRFEGFRLGTRLPPALVVLVSSLGAIQTNEPALLSAISEIRVMQAASGEAELLIYPLNQRIPVRAGLPLDAPTLRSMILVLDVLGTRGLAASVEEVDFRTGTVVYKTKEGQPG